MDLVEYVKTHTRTSHSDDAIDLIFFRVEIVGEPDAETFRKLVVDYEPVFMNTDIFDGQEHSYIELGAWIGDQGLALKAMALGYSLGLWKMITPAMIFSHLPRENVEALAGMGLITIMVE